MKNKRILTTHDAVQIAAACRDKAEKAGRLATIAVVDDAGNLLYLERPETMTMLSIEASIMKARTASLYARATSLMEQRVKDRPAFLAMPGLLAVPGGVPLFEGETCIGGVAAGGAEKDDETIAQAGADFFQSRLVGAGG